jgi:hypothetical protein
MKKETVVAAACLLVVAMTPIATSTAALLFHPDNHAITETIFSLLVGR